MNYKQHTVCRVCGSKNLIEYLDLGMMPLSNNLCAADEQPEWYPLKVLFCEDCSLSQLSVVIDPEILFGHYVYRSSISQGYKDHCREMAIELKEKYNLNKDSFHIDIAGNDGALLNEFKKVMEYDKCVTGIEKSQHYKCLNVDPANNLYELNEKQGIRMLCEFWGLEAAKTLMVLKWPKADLITATNVFAHVDNVKEFLLAAKMTLKETGVIVLEFPYLIDFIEKTEFDTIYFEHLSYFAIKPLHFLCDQIGLNIMNIQHKDIHGGTVRITIGYDKEDKTAMGYVIKEKAYCNIKLYQDFAKKIKIIINNFRNRIRGLVQEGKYIAAFAASAKGNTLLNCASITDKEIKYIVDETPEKIGKYSPGTNIEIVDMGHFKNNFPDYLVILSWNFKNEIINKCRNAGYKGKYILPLTFETI